MNNHTVRRPRQVGPGIDRTGTRNQARPGFIQESTAIMKHTGFGRALIGVAIAGGSLAAAWGADVAEARKAYNLTEYTQSLQILRAIPDKDGAVYELMGLNYYGMCDFKKATEILEK